MHNLYARMYVFIIVSCIYARMDLQDITKPDPEYH